MLLVFILSSHTHFRSNTHTYIYTFSNSNMIVGHTRLQILTFYTDVQAFTHTHTHTPARPRLHTNLVLLKVGTLSSDSVLIWPSDRQRELTHINKSYGDGKKVTNDRIGMCDLNPEV